MDVGCRPVGRSSIFANCLTSMMESVPAAVLVTKAKRLSALNAMSWGPAPVGMVPPPRCRSGEDGDPGISWLPSCSAIGDPEVMLIGLQRQACRVWADIKVRQTRHAAVSTTATC